VDCGGVTTDGVAAVPVMWGRTGVVAWVAGFFAAVVTTTRSTGGSPSLGVAGRGCVAESTSTVPAAAPRKRAAARARKRTLCSSAAITARRVRLR
jgi:hypothetical protein